MIGGARSRIHTGSRGARSFQGREVEMATERIELARVEFIEAINRPGGYNQDGAVHVSDQREGLATVVDPNNRLKTRQRFNLWYDPVRSVVYVEHPESGVREQVPRENVLQWREVEPMKHWARSERACNLRYGNCDPHRPADGARPYSQSAAERCAWCGVKQTKSFKGGACGLCISRNANECWRCGAGWVAQVMSFMRRLSRRAPAGGLILPREVAARGSGQLPKCALCMRAVDGLRARERDGLGD